MSDYQVTVVAHTHWDREWYQPFAVFQARLVETVDRVLDLLDGDHSFSHFMLDGQAVVLDDYLALRPEAAERIRAHVQSGRLAIGPWYTLADEFLSSPEALVRNLLIGRKTCRRFGEPMEVVYTPDSFGHISQLPRLARGFGFDSLVFERGVGDEGEELGGEFRWEAADGSGSVLAVHLLGTYSSGAGIGYRDWTRYADFDPQRAVAHAKKAIYGGDERIGMEEWLDESLARIPGGSSAYASGSHLLLLNGSDHLPPQGDLPTVLGLLNEQVDGARFELGRLREYIEGVLGEGAQLPRHRGEFRGSRYHHVLSGVYSARIYLKQANHAAQQALERYGEPLAAFAAMSGAPYPAAVLEAAWKELLRNHCHDSICGCSVDQVHEEMMPRFAAVRSAAGYVGRKALAHLAGGRWEVPPAPVIEPRLTPPAAAASELPALTAFNPLPWAWRGLLRAEVPLPDGSTPAAVRYADGKPADSLVRVEEVPAPGDARRRERVAKVEWLAELAPLSVTSFRLHTGADQTPGGAAEEPERTRASRVAGDRGGEGRGVGGVAAGLTYSASTVTDGPPGGGHVLVNELLQVRCGRDGLIMHDRRSGAQTTVRLYLEDAGDAGDEYDYSPVADDVPVLLPLADLELMPGHAEERQLEARGLEAHESGPGEFVPGASSATTELGQALIACGELRLPAALAADRSRREGEARLPFSVELRLEPGDPFLRLGLVLENDARDHRLRLVAETDLTARSVAVEGHFDVLERPLTVVPAAKWFQKPSGTDHQRRFLAIAEGDRGVAILNDGLPEYGGEPAAGGGTRVAVTLLRCVGWLSRNDLSSRPQGAGPALPTPGAQCLGKHRFELALMPYGGRWDEAGVPAAADRFTTPPLVEATPAEADGVPLLELPDGLQLSAVKRAEASSELIVRFWNPGLSRVEGAVRFGRAPSSVRLVELDESVQREFPSTAEVPLSLEPKEVVTLAISVGGEEME